MDVVLDSNYLADFLAQCYDAGAADRGNGQFRPQGRISRRLARRLNQVMLCKDGEIPGMVVSSVLAFVEIGRKWDVIVNERFRVEQMHAFLKQPPEWFDVAPIDEDLLPFFVDVPTHSGGQPLEFEDAIHMATLFSRGPGAALGTSDTRIRAALGSRSDVQFL